jgi:hypothetical protein
LQEHSARGIPLIWRLPSPRWLERSESRYFAAVWRALVRESPPKILLNVSQVPPDLREEMTDTLGLAVGMNTRDVFGISRAGTILLDGSRSLHVAREFTDGGYRPPGRGADDARPDDDADEKKAASIPENNEILLSDLPDDGHLSLQTDERAAAGRLEAPAPEPRFLQALVARSEGDIDNTVDRGALQLNTPYRVAVRIGRSAQEWLSAEKPFELEFPDSEPQRLEVWFWDPECAPIRQLEYLDVPPVGDSQPCIFHFRTPPRMGELRARIVVIKEGRILQAGVLTATIGLTADVRAPRFVIDVAAQFSIAHPHSPPPFINTLFIDRADSQPGLTVTSDKLEGLVRFSENALNQFTNGVNDTITRIKYGPQEFESIQSKSSVRLLRQLAQHGSALYEELTRQAPQILGVVNKGRLNVASAPNAYLPVEFMYREEAPDDNAPLCSGFQEALERGTCCGQCKTKPRQVICPLGFLGLSQVIERQAGMGEGLPDPLQEEFRLMLLADDPSAKVRALSGIVFGASTRANKHDTTVVESVENCVKSQSGSPASTVANTWEAWQRAINEVAPSLLLLLPHHETEDSFDYLQIGPERAEGDPPDEHPGYLKSVLLRSQHVKRAADDPPPIVMLIGCETQMSRIGFENFVHAFRRRGARVVIATVATILGRHAGPVACALLNEIKAAAARQETLGQAILAAKRKLVAKGVIVATALTVYGGADCQLVAA